MTNTPDIHTIITHTFGKDTDPEQYSYTTYADANEARHGLHVTLAEARRRVLAEGDDPELATAVLIERTR